MEKGIMDKEQIVAFLKRNSRMLTGAAAAGVILISFGAYALLPSHSADPVTTDAVRLASTDGKVQSPPPRMLENGMPFSFADLVERVSPAVVSVTADEIEKTNGQPDLDGMPDAFRDLFRQFGGRMPQVQPQVRKAVSMGSGFIIEKSGLIVTDNHVVDGATKVKVKLADGRTSMPRSSAPMRPPTLRCSGSRPTSRCRPSNSATTAPCAWAIGWWRWAIQQLVEFGHGRHRFLDRARHRQYRSALYRLHPDRRSHQSRQFGGPTFDLRGQVVGMNSMIFSPTGGSIGIGFAIPASTIKDVLRRLRS